MDQQDLEEVRPAEEQSQVEEHDADFAAGYNGTPTETPEPQSTEETQQPEKPAEQPADPEPEFVQISKKDWEDIQVKVNALNPGVIDKAFGKIGGLERALQDIQSKTPTGESIELTDADFAELAEEFPELAQTTKAVFGKVLEKFKGTGPSTNPEQIQSLVDQGLSARETTRRAEETKLVEAEYSNWREIVASPEFDTYFKTLTPREQRRIANTWDADRVLNALDGFQKFKTEQENARLTKEQEAKAKQTDTRQQRFQDAVQPRGAGGHPPPPTGDDDFAAGYNQSKS